MPPLMPAAGLRASGCGSALAVGGGGGDPFPWGAALIWRVPKIGRGGESRPRVPRVVRPREFKGAVSACLPSSREGILGADTHRVRVIIVIAPRFPGAPGTHPHFVFNRIMELSSTKPITNGPQ